MVRKLVVLAGLFAVSTSLSGCFSLNFDETVRMINTWGQDAHEMRVMTNKYFFNFDRDDPFAEY